VVINQVIGAFTGMSLIPLPLNWTYNLDIYPEPLDSTLPRYRKHSDRSRHVRMDYLASNPFFQCVVC
jgi:hypothetical protein